jgi:hypothetical protein
VSRSKEDCVARVEPLGYLLTSDASQYVQFDVDADIAKFLHGRGCEWEALLRPVRVGREEDVPTILGPAKCRAARRGVFWLE